MAGQRKELSTITLHLALWSLAVVALILLMAPTVIVVWVSFTSGYSLKFPPPGYSLQWYRALIDAWQLQFAAGNSLEVAGATTVLAILLGVSASIGIARSEKVSARVLDSLFMSPLIL